MTSRLVVLLACVLCLVLCSGAAAFERVLFTGFEGAPVSTGDASVSQDELPRLILSGHARDARFVRVREWLHTHPGLTAFRLRSKFHELRARCRGVCRVTQIKLESPTGEPIVEMTGSEIPDDPDELLGKLAIRAANELYEARRICDRKGCRIIPDRQASQPESNGPVVPKDIRRPGPAAAVSRSVPSMNWLLIGGLVAVALVAGYAAQWGRYHA